MKQTIIRCIKYGLYTIGIVLIFISFLFFARDMPTYDLLFNLGILIATITFLIILMSAFAKKEKLLFVLLTVFLIFCQYASEPLLIKTSYLIYLSDNQSTLSKMNQILVQSDSTSYYFNDLAETTGLSQQNYGTVNKLKEKAGVKFISLNEDKIHYQIWGRLDIGHGLTYFYNNSNVDKTRYRHLSGSWYY